jgi:hypothetical protein
MKKSTKLNQDTESIEDFNNLDISHRDMSILVENLVCQPYKIAEILKNKDWEKLEALTNFLNNFPKLVLPLAQSDPARFRKLMAGITQCYILGWHNLNKEKINSLKSKKSD